MCGFVGYLGNITNAEESLRVMAMSIAHRGPDGTGFWFDHQNQFGVAHQRLAVLDLSQSGHQPMESHSGRYIIAFNGEIYNHLALRDNLKNRSWKGHSDTETLLAGFECWGIAETVKKTVGMFAFAVWDRQLRSLTLGRDRFGEKPLYYGWQGTGDRAVFLFGSELKALRLAPTADMVINRNALALYMRHAYVPAPFTIYQGVEKLMPGSLATLSLDCPAVKHEVYWSASTMARNGALQPFSGTENDAIISLEQLLKDGIRQQMEADVPLGAFLSGGVDSSSVVALMQGQSTRPIRTFSIGFDEGAYDEAVYAKQIAAHLGTDHTELYVSSQTAMSVIPRLPELYDEPFADSSQIPTFLVSEMARKYVTVSLSGDGADELFGGYNRYQITADTWSNLSKIPVPLRAALASVILKVSPGAWDRLLSMTPFANRWVGLGYKLHKGADVMSAVSVSELYKKLISQWSNPEEIVIGAHEPATLVTGNTSDFEGLCDVEQMMALDMLTYLTDDILTKVDRAAMGVSLETRVPFLDHRVAEFAWSLPLNYKLHREGNWLTTKWVLRQVLYRHIPRHLIERPKMGFGIPIDSWLRGPLRDWAEDLLDESRLRREGYLNPLPVRQRWREHLSGTRDWQHSLWCVLMFQAWLGSQAKGLR